MRLGWNYAEGGVLRVAVLVFLSGRLFESSAQLCDVYPQDQALFGCGGAGFGGRGIFTTPPPAEELRKITRLTRRLHLNRNRLARLNVTDFEVGPESAAHYAAIISVDLGSNHITVVAEGTFVWFSGLERLSLRGNRIRELSPGGFTGLGKVAHLYINHNQLSIVRAGDLEGLTALERILFDSQDRTDSSGKPLLTTIAIACFPQIPGDVGRATFGDPAAHCPCHPERPCPQYADPRLSDGELTAIVASACIVVTIAIEIIQRRRQAKSADQDNVTASARRASDSGGDISFASDEFGSSS